MGNDSRKSGWFHVNRMIDFLSNLRLIVTHASNNFDRR